MFFKSIFDGSKDSQATTSSASDVTSLLQKFFGGVASEGSDGSSSGDEKDTSLFHEKEQDSLPADSEVYCLSLMRFFSLHILTSSINEGELWKQVVALYIDRFMRREGKRAKRSDAKLSSRICIRNCQNRETD